MCQRYARELPGADVPKAGALVGTAGDQHAAVGAEGEAFHAAMVLQDGTERRPRGRVPQADRAVVAACGQDFTIRTETDCRDEIMVNLVLAQKLSAGHV